MSESLENEFLDMITKMRANLATRHDNGDLRDRDYYNQIEQIEELVRMHNNSGWSSSGCAWESSQVC